jgi:hypothetical protein
MRQTARRAKEHVVPLKHEIFFFCPLCGRFFGIWGSLRRMGDPLSFVPSKIFNNTQINKGRVNIQGVSQRTCCLIHAGFMLILRTWRWRWHIPPKSKLIFNELCIPEGTTRRCGYEFLYSEILLEYIIIIIIIIIINWNVSYILWREV